jgi:hypothetical protein
MKIVFTYVFIISFTVVLFLACDKDSESNVAEEIPPNLGLIKSKINSTFHDMDTALVRGVNTVAGTGIVEPAIRQVLTSYTREFNYLMDCGFISSQGILQYIEPAQFRSSEGVDINQQAHIIKIRQTRKPVLSGSFYAVEGFWSVTYAHPILQDTSFLGSLFLLVKPELFLKSIITPYTQGTNENYWVMEKGGRIIYDPDTMEIGRNLFQDTLYASFPQLITAGHAIDSQDNGQTTYQFYDTGIHNIVTRVAFWTTINIYGTEWKLVYIR